jgi:hypothetical protein
MKKLFVTILIITVGCLAFIIAIAHSKAGGKLLMFGARCGSVFMIRTTMAFGVNVNSKDENGGTALFFAAANGRMDAIKLLLSNGADARAVDRDGNTALCYALNSSEPNIPVAKMLIEEGALEKQMLHGSPFACVDHSASSEAYINMLLEEGVDVNNSDRQGHTALMKFAYDGNPRAVTTLVQHGANVNAIASDGKTALAEAVLQGNEQVVGLLLNAGADPKVRINGYSLEDIASNQMRNFENVNSIVPGKYLHIIQLLASKN